LANLRILDCTLRDGSYPINYQFTLSDTAEITKVLNSSGIEYIEVGHGMGLGASGNKYGEMLHDDVLYVEKAVEHSGSSKIGVFAIPGIVNFKGIQDAKKAGAKFIRFGADANKHFLLRDLINFAKKIDLEVSANLMKTYAVSEANVAEACKHIESWGADAISVVDSAGTMVPSEVSKYVGAIKQVTNIPIGFHGHNNLQMAIANSLSAVKSGAEIVDGTIRGIGRSSGNAQLDILISVFEKEGFATPYDQFEIGLFGDLYLAKSILDVGIDRIEVQCGISGMHSSFLNQVVSAAVKNKIDPAKLIYEISLINKIDVTDKLIDEVCLKILGKENLHKSKSYQNLSYLKSQLDPINRYRDSLGQLLVKAKQNDKPSILILSNKTIVTKVTKKMEISETTKGFLLNLDISTNQFSQFMSENIDLIQKVDILGFDLHFKDFIKNKRYPKKYFYFNEIDIEIAALNSFLLQTIPYSEEICLVYSAENTPMYRQLINRYSSFFSCVDISNHNKTGLNNSNYKAFLVEGNTLSDINLLNLKTKPNFIISYKFNDVFYGLDEVKLIRLSGRKILDAYIDTLLSQSFNLNIDNYLRKFKEFTLVSGGLVGQNGNLIVNSVVLPTELVGVADGNGDFKELSNEEILGLSDFFDVLSSNKFDHLYGTD
jgi:4-hydroxy 2-oxovalerate aldolase